MLVNDDALVTHVEHPAVPLVVIVPPVRGLEKVMLVTVPEPEAGVAQVLSPLRKVVELGVPVADRSAIATSEDVTP